MDFVTETYWKGFRVSWGTPKHQGELKPHRFELVVDHLDRSEVVDELSCC